MLNIHLMSTVNARIDLLINELRLNKNSFAKEIDTSATVIQNIVGARQSKPGFDLLNKIITTFNVSADWLLTGDGAMLKESKPKRSVLKSESSELLRRVEELAVENAMLKTKVTELEARLNEKK